MDTPAIRTALLGMLLLLCACSERPPDSSNLNAIQNALERLGRQRPEGFLIIRVAETQQFVQFIPDGSSGYLIDIPSQTLSTAEGARAAAFFEQRGHMPPKELNDTEGQFTFQATLQDAPQAVQFAVAFLEEVFLCAPGSPLELTEGR